MAAVEDSEIESAGCIILTRDVLCICLAPEGVSTLRLNPSHTLLRVGMAEGMSEESFLAALEQLGVKANASSPTSRLLHAHELYPLSAPWTSPVRCREVRVLIDAASLACEKARAQGVILIDFRPETRHIGVVDILKAEVARLGLRSPGTFRVSRVDGDHTLSDIVTRTGPLSDDHPRVPVAFVGATMDVGVHGWRPCCASVPPPDAVIVLTRGHSRNVPGLNPLRVLCCADYATARRNVYAGNTTTTWMRHVAPPSVADLNALVAMAMAICEVSGASLEDVLSGGRPAVSAALMRKTVGATDTLPLLDAPARHTGKRRTRAESVAQESYEGGLVLEARVGICRTPSVLIDFNSHYPAIIAEYDIAPRMADDVADRRNAIIDVLLRKRREQDPLKRRALKLVANAYYGSLNYERSPTRCIRMASEITQHGRRELSELVRVVEEVEGGTVLCGHTDSVLATGVARPEDVVRQVNADRPFVCVEIEDRFALVWTTSRTSYVAVRSGRSADDLLAEATRLVQGLTTLVAAPPLFTPPLPPPPHERFAQGATIVRVMSDALMASNATHLKRPGLLTTLFPAIINILNVVVAVCMCATWLDADVAGAAADLVRTCVEALVAGDDTVPLEKLAAWTHAFKRPSSQRVVLGSKTDANYRAHLVNTLSGTRTAYICSVYDPKDGHIIVDLAQRTHRVNRQYWLHRLVQRWHSTLGRSVPDQGDRTMATAILQPLVDRLGTYRPPAGPPRAPTMSSTTATANEASRRLGAQVPALPTSIVNVLPLVANNTWPVHGPDPERYGRDITAYIARIEALQDTDVRTLALDHLLLATDVDEAIRRIGATYEEVQQRQQDPAVSPYRAVYHHILVALSQRPTE